jgi:hypothetical protein
MSVDPINLTEWAVPPEQIAALQGKLATTTVAKSRTPTHSFAQFHYETLLTLAGSTRNALLAVIAILHHRQFKSWAKAEPITLGNRRLRALGFHHSDKIRALRELENAGWITVQWCERKSPKVSIVKGFRF